MTERRMVLAGTGSGVGKTSGQNNNFILKDLIARGHEFHYSSFQPAEEDVPYAYETKGLRGLGKEGYLLHNLAAGYTHFHFGSCPAMVTNWIHKCLEYKESRGKTI
ncbi:MAG TPA: hypothetical protein VNM45_05830 [Bacillus sp. (in: firmicutes)]|nr:hypothetical protein [Bacillus sp. (in: firmicutes)]